MDRFELSMPECYLDSADFRFFLKWASSSLYKIQYDLDTFFDSIYNKYDMLIVGNFISNNNTDLYNSIFERFNYIVCNYIK